MQNQSHDFNQLNYDTALYYHPTASMAAPVAGVDSLYDVETSPQQTSYPIPSWASNASLSPVTPVVHDDASPLMNRTPNNITTTSSLSSSSTRSSNSKSRTGGNRSKRPKRKQVKNACVNCQKACKKCDDGRPCQRCIKLGLVATCTNSPRKERKKGVKRGPYKKRQQRKMQLQQQQQQASSQQQVPMLTGDVNMMPLYDDYCPPALDLSRPRQVHERVGCSERQRPIRLCSFDAHDAPPASAAIDHNQHVGWQCSDSPVDGSGRAAASFTDLLLALVF
ncbi:hypothetical protein BCR43DRAFT_92745 [Syncephalastrum racemosum]|uniref:Zn(2)-C6 fungal-type domain-containing protein n=1 Tax=Syncephalastrum racemosum TaxID=13706 RepID=A0A1X2H0P9_SYNRA|nr:hypothetical protein BCR43DRAFT_92745 [Syncephalastrum racemosum]